MLQTGAVTRKGDPHLDQKLVIELWSGGRSAPAQAVSTVLTRCARERLKLCLGSRVAWNGTPCPSTRVETLEVSGMSVISSVSFALKDRLSSASSWSSESLLTFRSSHDTSGTGRWAPSLIGLGLAVL